MMISKLTLYKWVRCYIWYSEEGPMQCTKCNNPHISKQCINFTHTHTALWILSNTTLVSQYQKKRSPTYTYCGHQSSLIGFLHLLRSMASSCSIYIPDSLFSTISLQVFFGLPLGLAPSTSYSNHCLPFSAYPIPLQPVLL